MSGPDDWCSYLVYPKAGHYYLMTWPKGDVEPAIHQLGVMAANPELNFSWHDAAILGRALRRREAKGDSRRKDHAGDFKESG